MRGVGEKAAATPARGDRGGRSLVVLSWVCWENRKEGAPYRFFGMALFQIPERAHTPTLIHTHTHTHTPTCSRTRTVAEAHTVRDTLSCAQVYRDTDVCLYTHSNTHKRKLAHTHTHTHTQTPPRRHADRRRRHRAYVWPGLSGETQSGRICFSLCV